LCKNLPGAEPLGAKNETFQLFNPMSGEAISAQIRDTLIPNLQPILPESPMR